MSDEWETWDQKIGFWILAIPLVLCGMEMVPGWGMFNLGWPYTWFYAIAATTGLVGGGLLARGSRLAGICGGCIGSVGALYATVMLLENVNQIHSIMLAIVGMIGAIPGFIAYLVLKKLTIALSGESTPDNLPPMN